MAEIPSDIIEKHGSEGGKLWDKGRKTGVEEGKGVAQDPFAKEISGKVTTVINAKKKEGYKAKTIEELAKLVPFKIGEAMPDRTKLLSFISTAMATVESMPLPPKVVKKSSESTSS